MDYFEKVYLGKNEKTVSVVENKRLQKLLGAKAVHNADSSRSLSNADYMKMLQKKSSKEDLLNYNNYESFIKPFDIV